MKPLNRKCVLLTIAFAMVALSPICRAQTQELSYWFGHRGSEGQHAGRQGHNHRWSNELQRKG